jgi:hydrogenase nickel incorporation protein HypA/HybF
MHELSLATSIIEAVTEALADSPEARVLEVRLRVGALAAVEEESLQFCFGLASEGTQAAQARLVVHRLPVILHCSECNRESELPSVQSFLCPHCHGIKVTVRQGKEMEIESLEVDDGEESGTSPAAVPQR